MNLRATLGGLLGRGNGGAGTAHWRVQRTTALVLVPLTFWLLFALARLPLADHAATARWLGAGLNPLLLALTLLAIYRHSSLGVEVIITDYLHGPALRNAALQANRYGHLALLVAGLYAVVRLYLGSAA